MSPAHLAQGHAIIANSLATADVNRPSTRLRLARDEREWRRLLLHRPFILSAHRSLPKDANFRTQAYIMGLVLFMFQNAWPNVINQRSQSIRRRLCGV